MAKLKPDVIEWILKLNSTQAQEEYHKLEKANRELKKENEATRKSIPISGKIYNGEVKSSIKSKNFSNYFDIKNNIIIFAV